MKKNVASQVIGAHLVSATDGSAFTGTVTVYVTIDRGTQAIGSVGSGVCTHEGNGFHTYAPAQAETNGDHVAFTFVGSGAVGCTVQVYPNFPQTGDSFARLGAPVGASISADVAAVQSDTDNIQTRLPAALVSGRMDASVGAVANDAITAAALASDAGTEIGTAVWASTTRLLTAGTNIVLTKGTGVTGFNDLSAAAVNAEVDTAISDAALATAANLATVAGYIDTEVAAIKAKTDNLPASPAAVGDIPSAAAVADAVWDEAISGHLGAGSTGAAVNAAGSSGDPWSTPLPGAYGAGTAGQIVGDALDAAISTRAAPGDVPSAGAVADAVWDEALSGHVSTGTAGAGLRDADLRGARTVIRGTVGSATSPSTTQFTPSALSPAGAAADQFKGRIIIFDNDTATTSLRGQASDITANTSAGTPLFTFTALTTAPSSGDTFSIV